MAPGWALAVTVVLLGHAMAAARRPRAAEGMRGPGLLVQGSMRLRA
jgi:hypothetical protein